MPATECTADVVAACRTVRRDFPWLSKLEWGLEVSGRVGGAGDKDFLPEFALHAYTADGGHCACGVGATVEEAEAGLRKKLKRITPQ